MTGELQPADVYREVQHMAATVAWTQVLVKGLMLLVALQIAVKLFESYRLRLVGTRVEQHLDMIATHGAITDERTRQMKGSVETVKDAVVQVTAVVVGEIKAGSVLPGGASPSDSGTTLKTVTAPPPALPQNPLPPDVPVGRREGEPGHVPEPHRKG